VCDERVECPCVRKFEDIDFIADDMRSAVLKRLSRRQVLRIERLHDEFRTIDPLPLKAWILGLSTEPDPEHSILKTEVALHVFQKIAIMTDLNLEQRSQLFQAVLLIMANHRCVDPQRDIATELPDWESISIMCRRARETYATLCDS